MPEIQYPKNPNSDTAFVVQEDGTKNRALMTAPQDTSSLELPTNSNSCKGYVTVDGKKQRVILTADIGSGGGGGSVDKNTIINKAATLPTASASNVGQVYMYDGEDTEDYTHGYIYQSQPTYTDQSATISQTVGGDSISFETISGNTTISGDMQAFNNLLENIGWTQSDVPSTGTLEFKWERADEAWFLTLPSSGWGELYTQNFLEEMGFVFTGTPASGDKIIATYRFGLSNLSVDVNQFVEAEQPSGSETVSFVASGTAPTVELYNQTPGDWSVSVNPAVFIPQFENETGLTLADIAADDECYLEYYTKAGWVLVHPNGQTDANPIEDWGFDISGDLVAGLQVFIRGIPGNQEWSKNGTTVDLADYGISYNGTPANGDTLTVAYTAASISGYAWNQINVQPGGAEGIKWVGHWDKPADVRYYWYCAGFDFAILPAGTYEFYFQNKQLRNLVANSAVWNTKTWKATIVVVTDGGNREISGTLAWVLDGQTTFGNYNLSTDARCYYTTDMTTKDRIATVVSQTAGMIGNDIERQSVVPELFRWTNIKNVDTGLEYPVTVDVVQENAPQLTYYLGDITSGSAVNEPERAVYQRVLEAEFNNNQQRFVLGSTFDANETRAGSFAECDLEMVTANGHYRAKITNYIRSSILRVYEASGDLANVQIGTLDEGELQIMLNTPTDTTGTIQAVVSVSGSANYFYLNGLYEPWTLTRVLTPTKIGGTVTPENFGMILQYDGMTDANYTNGYFYKAAGTKVVTPKSIAFSDYNVSATVSVTDIDALITEIQNYTGWSTSDIESYLGEQHTWTISYSTTDGVTYVDFEFWDTGEASVLQYISVTYDQDGDITCLATYTPETTTITNGHWERVDVQPAGTANKATGAYATGIGENTTSFPVNVTGAYATGVGPAVHATGDSGTALGADAAADGNYSLALGVGARANAAHAIQISSWERGSWALNNTPNTLKVHNGNGNFMLMDASGNLPADRLASTANLADGNYRLRLVMASGVPTLEWVAEQV